MPTYSTEMSAQDDAPVMYIVVNSQLPMSSGKVAAQVAHSACAVIEHLAVHPTPLYREWKRTAFAKIVLEGKQSVLERCIKEFSNREGEQWCAWTHDAGRTEIPSGSLTTVAFAPMRRSSRPPWLARLGCLRDRAPKAAPEPEKPSAARTTNEVIEAEQPAASS